METDKLQPEGEDSQLSGASTLHIAVKEKCWRKSWKYVSEKQLSTWRCAVGVGCGLPSVLCCLGGWDQDSVGGALLGPLT